MTSLRTLMRAKKVGSQYCGHHSTGARFNALFGIAFDTTDLFVTDTGSHTIRKVTTGSVVVTLAGTAGLGLTLQMVLAPQRFNLPIGLTIDNAGNLYVSDQNYTKIRKIVTSTGVVTTVSATF